ncbi:ABC transporter permease [Pelagicoccus sp. NFK12]|uniref:ABC transporter permease n=1 Tax=Pelagicoccus enzymogenes TaxID=2773457 RepID=A0A927IIY9_9BACT|nr:ABC transporter permease [Pelagicoccus enzymogenes]MBD5781756.1 ABC transporter permease [Pelagicoccus enzymogenes]
MLNDLRFSFRQIVRSPGFTLLAAITLALGIGANTAIFSLINALLLKPLPYEQSDQIVQLNLDTGQGPNAFAPMSGGIFLDIENASEQFESLSVLRNLSLNLTGIEEPVRLNGYEVSASYLQIFGLSVALGQDITPENDSAGGNNRVVLLSDSAWKTQFGEDPTIVGSNITLDYQSYTISGILKPNTFMTTGVDFLVPAAIAANEWKQLRKYDYVCSIVGRLKEGATPATATAELQAIKASLNEQYPDMMKEWTIAVRTLQDAYFGSSTPYIVILLVAVAMVLLVACANVANLLLARATARQGEIAVRTSVGASGWQIVRQLLVESTMLSLVGAAIGLLIGIVSLRPLAKLVGFAELPNIDLSIDLRVLLFTLAISIFTGILFGIFPALKTLNTAAALRDSTRSATSAKGNKLQSTLIVAEIALSVVLLVSIGLLLKSSLKAFETDPGFSDENVLTFEIERSGTRSPTPEDRTRFSSAVIERIGELPGVESVAMVSSTPMNGNQFFGAPFWRDDQPDTANSYFTGFDSVNGNLFKTLGIPLLQGRIFDERDQQPDSPKVVVINQKVVEDKFQDGLDPLGQMIHHDNEIWQVVGVVGNISRFSLDSGEQPMVYKPMIQWPWHTSYVVKTQLPPLQLTDQIKEAVLAVDSEQPIDRVRTLEQAVKQSLQGRTIMVTLIGIFGGIAIILAATGIYGLMSYLVEQRNREIGIRLAIGALPNEIVGMIFKRGLKLTAIGLVIGIVAVIGIGRYLAFILYQVEPYDPIVLAVVSLLTLLITLAACWRPATTASKILPSVALRLE